ncbi:hypothetical protein QAD02_015331 [Eretmocerus hayati]|uniref:Uncharacterized protein n=1 Tax=Eretmocerus hayati TaxID=131215 RepID=A0ACC2P8D7_9HYME|nr:hypothetical protein QAD02_015331 [Eretmocerus hayati]
MMMRINFKTLVLLLVVGVLSSMFTSWNNCSNSFFIKNANWRPHFQYKDHPANEVGFQEIDCLINHQRTVSCRKDDDEIFIPFSFLQEYFGIFGKIVVNDDVERFEWSHSNVKISDRRGKYDSRGVFMTFENYNVEVRDRVKCISGTHGVPISTQWNSQGYYYPTQIAQFGLSHYSKNLSEPEPVRKIFEDADSVKSQWVVPTGSIMNRVYDSKVASYVIKYATPEMSAGITLKLDHFSKLMLSLDLCIQSNSSMAVELQMREKKETYFLHYIANNVILTTHKNHIYYGIGQVHNHWKHLTRDLMVDLQKGLILIEKTKRKLTRSKIKIVRLVLRGSGSVDNVTLSTSEHMEQFYDAAHWFVENQNVTSGGWPNAVERNVCPGMAKLEPGWYSAMGQGHAISVLSRAYYRSGDEQYLQAAVRGLRPFRLTSSNGGVAAYFMDKYVWYEEYPTTPSSFILNGFIYSLIGLYDLKSIASGKDAEEARQLFDNGMISLKNMLTLFDTGSGTTYDLRHVTLRTAPNLARWDYHLTHINQLLSLSTIDSDPIFPTTLKRWIDYTNGIKAPHN